MKRLLSISAALLISLQVVFGATGDKTVVGPFNSFGNISTSSLKVKSTNPNDTTKFISDGNLSVTGSGKNITFSGAALVPYSSAVRNVKLGSKTLTTDAVYLNTTPSATPTGEGAIYWDTQDHTLNVRSEIAASTLNVGQEQWLRVVNKTGVQINDGQAVYVSGAQGNRPTASLAKANSEATSYTIGIATDNIANNAEGYVTVFGLVRGYDTSAFAAGDKLYLSATTAGALTTTRPQAPNHGTFVAFALNSTNNGLIFVNPDTGSELDELHDVLIGAKTYGDILGWNSATGVWENTRKIGDGTNSSEFETDGTLKFNGTATVWNDIVININTLTAGGAPPIQRAYNGGSVVGWAFNGTNPNSMMGWFEVPHDYKEGTTLDVHVHFSPEGALTAGQTIIFTVAYDIVGMNSATHTTGTLTATYTAPATPLAAWAHIYMDVGAILGTGRKIGDVCGFEITRSALTDTYNGYVHLISMGSHYESDTVGSRSEYAK